MKRIYTFDSLKLLSIFAVFVIHYGIFYYFGGIEHNSYYLSFNIVARFAVPVFFVIAGFLYYHKVQQGGWPYTKKYLGQLVLMYVTWTMIYLVAFGVGRNSWRPFDLLNLLYFGTWGVEILWFLVALAIAIGTQYLAFRTNQTKALFVLACILHLVGLTGQGYQTLIPLGLFDSANEFFNQSRDPLFFALFYVSLGYQLAQPKWLELITKLKWQPLLIACLIFMALSAWEGITLIQSHGSKIADYYITTIPLTLSLICLAIRWPNTDRPSVFSRLGIHSGELYLNHGVVQMMQGTIFWMIGYYRVPEMMSQQASNLWLQSLLVPCMFLLNIGLYLTVRKVYRTFIASNIISTYRESAMILNAFWLLFFTMQSSEQTTLFDVESPMAIMVAIVCAITSYVLVLHILKQIKTGIIDILKQHLIVVMSTSVFWIMMAYTGALTSLYHAYNPELPVIESLLKSPLLLYSLLYLITIGLTLALQSRVYQAKLPPITAASH
ncbi:acyltransferase [Photobacterium sp. SDRW27]|uniref:acyltransferase family protein n=1 Tax=Photobacterium obscurum TaxID=2829490 RepID=UPI002243DD15|nr:acyltransferase family protein [Photobacterium obscurum]MCW8329797.1 acyltransferase [Photobacterium obscurum]